jgi:hypothetical protein
LGDHFWISQNLYFVLGDLGPPKTFLQKVDFSSDTNENFEENSHRQTKHPNHRLLVHNLHTTKEKKKKEEKVFVGWKVRPNGQIVFILRHQ